MTFIKNRRAWLRWKRKTMGNQDGVTEPSQYPCFAYTSVGSFGYEEYLENYLYAKDVWRMGRQMSAEHAQTGTDSAP